MPLPIQFTLHSYIVTEYAGEQDRFDVFGFTEDRPWESAGHLYKNYHGPAISRPVLAIGSKRFCSISYNGEQSYSFRLAAKRARR